MEKFELNEEQKGLMKKLSDDVNAIIERYSNMNDAFSSSIYKIERKMNKRSDDDCIEELKDEIKTLEEYTRNVVEKLSKINYIANGYDGYKNAASLLSAVQSFISDAIYELGKLDGSSSGKIYTYSNKITLNGDYERLKKSLLGE